MSAPPRDEAAFWHALAASPTDEFLHSAFADWLDERSDVRTAFFRDPILARFMRPGHADPLPGLLEALAIQDYETWQAAEQGLARLGAPAVPELLRRCA